MAAHDQSPGAPTDLPGTHEHQRLLRGLAAHYAEDDRVLAVAVFGSLGRGTWDAYSDLDLDVVLVDDVRIDVLAEVRGLCEALGEQPAVLISDGPDAADVVLASLLQLSIRYHPLRDTSPNIVDSLMVLTGRIVAAEIVAAGRANRAAPSAGLPDLPELLGACVRMAVLTDAQLHRRKPWFAYSSLHATRERLLRLVARCHDQPRPYHALEAADDALRAAFAPTLPSGRDPPSVQLAFLSLLDVLEHQLESFSKGQVRLTDAERHLLARLRYRQASFDLSVE